MSILFYALAFKKADVENPNQLCPFSLSKKNPNQHTMSIDKVHVVNAEDGERFECLGLFVGAWVTWTILFVVGLVFIFCRSVHAPKAVRSLVGCGFAFAILGYACVITWCGTVLLSRRCGSNVRR
jgi:hypothetical protein